MDLPERSVELATLDKLLAESAAGGRVALISGEAGAGKSSLAAAFAEAAGPRAVRGLRIVPREFVFRYDTAEHYIDFLRVHYGPTVKAFEALGTDGGKPLFDDLVALASRLNVATDGTLKIPAAYLQVLAVRG